jgi:hypothetical protein
MNHREPPHRAAGMGRALYYISLLLVPALVPKNVSGSSRHRPNADAALDLRGVEPVLLPYLAAVGPPPLRFQTLPPPPDLTVRPAAAAPPIPTSDHADAPVASKPNAETPAPAPQAPDALVASKRSEDAPAPTKAPPPSILPDDTHPAIRPEDFLPYFQIPGSGKPGDVNLLVPASLLRGAPASAPIAPSSATYTQSK